MDSIFEKYSVFDFFNVICTGLVLLFGFEIMGVSVFTSVSTFCAINTLANNNVTETISLVLYISLVLCCCYLAGSVIQGLSSFLQKKIICSEENAISNCLTNAGIIGNDTKMQVYADMATCFFAEKGINIHKKNFTEDQCKYFFAHCVYYIQVKGQHQKAEKMRELRGISAMLFCCFVLLPFVGTIIQLLAYVGVPFAYVNNIHWIKIVVIDVVFFVLALAFWFRTQKVIIDRIRMVLGVYDACIVAESRKDKNEELSV